MLLLPNPSGLAKMRWQRISSTDFTDYAWKNPFPKFVVSNSPTASFLTALYQPLDFKRVYDMEKENRDQWERFLTPQVLRSNMITTSVYISAFEILKNSIIDRIRDFYWTGYEAGRGDIIDPSYESEVLSKNKSQLYASLLWLKASEAICDEDFEKFEKIKSIRNKLAHEINHLLVNGLPIDLPERFSDMVALLAKIERWWIVNVEIPINPDLADKEIDEEGIVPGPVANIRMMIDIALGSDEEAEFYINEFKKAGLL